MSFNTSGSGTSDSAHFGVGQVAFTPGVYEGGGIYQNVFLPYGPYTVSAQIAAYAPVGNSECGRFEILIDAVIVGSHTFGLCNSGETVRSSLLGSVFVNFAGSHLLTVRVTRPFITSGVTPEQYVDNVRVLQKLSKV